MTSMIKRMACWLAFFACVMLVGGCLVGLTGHGGMALAETVLMPADASKASTSDKIISEPDVVMVGAYLNDVQAIDLKNHNYMVDFYLWFRWKNPDIDPSSSLEFVNHSESWGTIITKSYEKPEVLPDGQLYQVIHVEGRMSRKLDLRDYPFDKQSISIEIEDAVRDTFGQKYVVDSISVNPALKLPGFQYKPPTMQSDDYTHPTNFGDTRVAQGSTYSRVSIELRVTRPIINAIVKNVLPILLTTICCSFVFLLSPKLVDSRFQIAIFSIFSIVALQITVGEDLPTVEYLTLLDTLYLYAYVYCIAVIALLIYITKLGHETAMDMAASVKVDRWGGGLLLGFYLMASGLVIAFALVR
ncbi:MAG: hypothetical protein FD135_4764 [Comamonadaceae bacterium]|nr:MAG: hypothetical protein FD135_4764 [Comamonadaceae bacterium]